MNVTLDSDQSRFVQQQVKSGRFSDARGVINAALSLLGEELARYQEHLEALRADIQIGIDAADAGDFVSIDDLHKQLAAARKDSRA